MRPPDGDFASKYSHTMKRDVVTVPVIRCFTNCSLGCKSIVYIHSTFPYFILDPSEIPVDPNSFSSTEEYLYTICKEIDNKALLACSHYRVVPTQVVHEAKLVSAKSVYGYNPTEKPFIHISIYHDRYKSKIQSLCRTGELFNTKITPYNLHFPHFQQFITDFKVYPLLETKVAKSKCFIRSSYIEQFGFSPFSNAASCLEIDISANDIINRYDIHNRAVPPIEMITTLVSQPSQPRRKSESSILKEAFANAISQATSIEINENRDGNGFFNYFKAPKFLDFQPEVSKSLSQSFSQSTQNPYKDIAVLPFAVYRIAFVETLFIDNKLFLISLLVSEFNDGFGETEKVLFALIPSPSYSQPTFGAKVFYCQDQNNLIFKFCKFIEVTDPDFILSFENSNAGLYPILNYKKLNTTKLLSRVISANNDEEFNESDAAYAFSKSPLNGRLVFSTEKIISRDMAYSYFSISLLAERELGYAFPDIDYEYLASPWTEQYDCSIERVFNYFSSLNDINLKLLERIDFFTKTSFFSLIYSTDFINALTRGSQFRVESILQRIGKSQGFVFPSPDKQDVADMEPPKFIPLVFEPKAKFYSSPVSVFDFESLYPTVMISFNICFSTCLGHTNEMQKLGCFNYKPPSGIDKFFTAPNDTRYVLKTTRLGLIPQMLTEILSGRRAIKAKLKQLNPDSRSYRSLDAAQLALKLVANVTYGYTSATFSGRMPCIDIADSIVSFGRQLMEDVIKKMDHHRVVYGDTDSLFVNFPGYNRKKAIEASQAIVFDVNSSLPSPIFLKYEKTYLKSFLVTKKRYTGFKVENYNDRPKLEVKGLEAIRRDNCPFVQDGMKKMLLSMFTDTNLVVLKNVYASIISQLENPNYASFIYSREIRLGSYKHEDRLPPAAAAAQKYFRVTKKNSVLGMRFPYVIQKGNGNVADRAIHPLHAHNIDELYYKEQLDKALHRIFMLGDINVMEFIVTFRKPVMFLPNVKMGDIDIDDRFKLLLNPPNFEVQTLKSYINLFCILCQCKLHNANSKSLFCISCGKNIKTCVILLIYRINYLTKQLFAIKKLYKLYYYSSEHVYSLHNDFFFKKDRIETQLKILYSLLNYVSKNLPEVIDTNNQIIEDISDSE